MPTLTLIFQRGEKRITTFLDDKPFRKEYMCIRFITADFFFSSFRICVAKICAGGSVEFNGMVGLKHFKFT